MKIVQINTFPYKATGSIMMNIHNKLLEIGEESYVVWGRGREAENEHEITILDNIGVKFHGIYTRLTDKTGFASKRATKRLIQELDRIQPDIIHLHNIHGYYVNIEMLFEYLKRNMIKVVWTFHDCWPFTGHCAYFDMIGCERWKKGCYGCPQKRTYPVSLLRDNSKWNWEKKSELFTGLDITIVTPSQWLKNIVEQSFLEQYKIEVINNGIDTEVFKPQKTSFYDSQKVSNKKIILGVASEWAERKGLIDFIKLRGLLSRDEYSIVLVGLEKKQIRELPDGIIGVERTANVQELVGIYSKADYFFNPTYDDNFPTTNLEAIACGTPVITYKTGGSPETICKQTGWVIEKGDLEAVLGILEKDIVLENVSLDKAFKKQSMIQSYLKLYTEIGARK